MQTVIEDLRRAIDEAAAQFAQLNDAETSAPLAADKWSRKQLLGHLIDSAANNHQRFIRAQLNGPKAFPGYEQTIACGLFLPTTTALLTAYEAFADRHAPSRDPFGIARRGLENGVLLSGAISMP